MEKRGIAKKFIMIIVAIVILLILISFFSVKQINDDSDENLGNLSALQWFLDLFGFKGQVEKAFGADASCKGDAIKPDKLLEYGKACMYSYKSLLNPIQTNMVYGYCSACLDCNVKGKVYNDGITTSVYWNCGYKNSAGPHKGYCDKDCFEGSVEEDFKDKDNPLDTDNYAECAPVKPLQYPKDNNELVCTKKCKTNLDCAGCQFCGPSGDTGYNVCINIDSLPFSNPPVLNGDIVQRNRNPDGSLINNNPWCSGNFALGIEVPQGVSTVVPPAFCQNGECKGFPRKPKFDNINDVNQKCTNNGNWLGGDNCEVCLSCEPTLGDAQMVCKDILNSGPDRGTGANTIFCGNGFQNGVATPGNFKCNGAGACVPA